MTRMTAIIVVVLVTAGIIGGAVLALREPIGCFFYLRSSHEGQIAFLRDGGVYVMESDGSNQCRILDDNAYLELAWSPDGQQLALLNLDGDIYTVQPNGSELRRVVSATDTEDRLIPGWSPDGTQIAYVRYSDTGGIYVAEVASGSERQITEGLPALFPVWSPVGDWIAFVTEENALYVVRADGSELRRLSDAAQFDKPPTWSPDGARIAFMNMDYEISAIDRDGSNEEVITDLNDEYDGQVFYVTWSPMGDQIAAEVIITHRPTRINLFVVNPATREARSLTAREENVTFAEWTPDGEHLLYTEFQDHDVLYRVNVASGLIERLAMGSGAAARPE